jgi:hypothetical protein
MSVYANVSTKYTGTATGSLLQRLTVLTVLAIGVAFLCFLSYSPRGVLLICCSLPPLSLGGFQPEKKQAVVFPSLPISPPVPLNSGLQQWQMPTPPVMNPRPVQPPFNAQPTPLPVVPPVFNFPVPNSVPMRPPPVAEPRPIPQGGHFTNMGPLLLPSVQPIKLEDPNRPGPFAHAPMLPPPRV